MDHKDDSNTLFLRYETGRKVRSCHAKYQKQDASQDCILINIFQSLFTQNTKEYILQVASFLGDSCPDRLLADDENILKLVMEHSSLDSMKKDSIRWCSDRVGYQPFIRKDTTGGWKELMSEEQAAKLQKRLDEKFTKEELEYLGDQYQ